MIVAVVWWFVSDFVFCCLCLCLFLVLWVESVRCERRGERRGKGSLKGGLREVGCGECGFLRCFWFEGSNLLKNLSRATSKFF